MRAKATKTVTCGKLTRKATACRKRVRVALTHTGDHAPCHLHHQERNHVSSTPIVPETYNAADADALLAWARIGDDWDYLTYAARRLNIEVPRTFQGYRDADGRRVEGEVLYTTLAITLAKAGVSWASICGWKK